MIGEVVVVDDVPSAFAAEVLSAAEVAVAAPEPTFRLALSGGGTARRCYERLAERASGAAFWSSTELLWGDERCVPLDDPDSNHRLAVDSLLSRVPSPRAEHPMDCGIGPETYDELLRSLPPLDIIHLGLGPDAHTASLFPQSTALEVTDGRLVVRNEDPTGHNIHPRMTVTLDGIAHSRLVIVTVEGAEKAEAFARVVAGDRSALASLVRSERVLWLVDPAASAGVSPR